MSSMLQFYEAKRPRQYSTEWYHRWLCLALERSYRLRRNLAVEMPPRSGKSEAIGVYGPAFRLDENSQEMFMAVSNSDSLAKKFSVGCRQLVELPLEIDRDSEWKVRGLESLNYSYRASGVRGQMTGHGASVLIFDDLLKSGLEAKSETVRNSVYENVCSAAINRLTPDGVVQVLQARLHVDDPLGRLLKSGMKWIRLRLPAWNDDGSSAFFEDQYAGEYVKFRAYAALSQRYPRERLEQIKEVSGPYYFSAQYLQEPSMGDMSYFDCDRMKRYEHVTGVERVWMAVDAANTETAHGSYTALVGMAFCGDHAKVVSVKRGRWRQDVMHAEVKDFYSALKRQTGVWPEAVVIEQAAGGWGLIDGLSYFLPVVPIKPLGSKEDRAGAVCYIPNRGQVHLPVSAPWLAEFVEELQNFPLGAYNDQVDAFVHALSYALRPSEFRPQKAEFVQTYDALAAEQHLLDGSDDDLDPVEKDMKRLGYL